MATLSALSKADLLNVLQRLITVIETKALDEQMIYQADYGVQYWQKQYNGKLSKYSGMRLAGILLLVFQIIPILINIAIIVCLIMGFEIPPGFDGAKDNPILKWVYIIAMLLILSIMVGFPVFLIVKGKKMKKDFPSSKFAKDALLSIEYYNQILAIKNKGVSQANTALTTLYRQYNVDQDLRYFNAITYCYEKIKSGSCTGINEALRDFGTYEHRQAMQALQREHNEKMQQEAQRMNSNLEDVKRGNANITDAINRNTEKTQEVKDILKKGW